MNLATFFTPNASKLVGKGAKCEITGYYLGSLRNVYYQRQFHAIVDNALYLACSKAMHPFARRQ